MARIKGANPIATGAIGAAGGAVIGAATGVLLTNKKARQKIASRLNDIKDYAEEAMSAVSDVAKEVQMGRTRYAGVKGGRTRKSRKTKQ